MLMYCDLSPKELKLNSRQVYCLGLYGTLKWIDDDLSQNDNFDFQDLIFKYSSQRPQQRLLDKRLYKTEMKFWAVFGKKTF